jgi:valyl-tRNA synthetase
MDDVPFHTVYIHARVRDEKGQKMSKSKGNIIDPLELIDSFGADALRMTLAALAAQGRDIKLSQGRVEGYRNFGTKLWNAARFCEMNGCERVPGFDARAAKETVNRWIAAKTADAADAVRAGLEAYKFNEAAGAVYQFTWGTFCDWYLEFAKPIFQGDDAQAAAETRATAAWVLDQLLHLLHPFMPYLTEELWAMRGGDALLIDAAWPDLAGFADDTAQAEMDWVVRLVSQVRSVRAEMHVPPGAEIPLMVKDAGDLAAACMERHAALISRLARLSELGHAGDTVPEGAVQDVLGSATLILALAGVIDIGQEKARLEKEIAKLDGEIGKFEKKLANEDFLAKAPEEVIAEQRARLDETAKSRARVVDALGRLG